ANYGAFLQDLYRAIILDSKATILNKNLEFYGSIANTVLKGNQVHRLKLHAGDIVELEEGIAYARIKSIFWHQANNSQYYGYFFYCIGLRQ
ncbi:11607_t:CDS:1, partial [Funneliformis geosporum]